MDVMAGDGVRLHVEPGTSNRPPLVLSNSLGTDVSLWDAQVPVFELQASVWRYDTRGHGRSGVPASETTIEQLGRDLVAVIDATGRAPVDVCGVSIGGMTALWVAIHAPDKVRRVVLANTAARIGTVTMWAERIRTAREHGMAPLASPTMERWFTADFRTRRPEVIERFRSVVASTSVDGYVACCAALRDADLREAAERVRCPVLVVTGTHDPATPPADGAWLAARIPGASLIDLDAAHLSNVERSDAFNAAVRGFLTGE